KNSSNNFSSKNTNSNFLNKVSLAGNISSHLESKKDSYLIKYISQKLCDYLNYQKSEVLQQDFHMFLPPAFHEEHRVLIKKILYLENFSTFKTSTFMLTKDSYFYPIDLKAIFLPSLVDKVTLIVDIVPKKRKTKISK